ncbi:hypothetical protein BSKO_04623 [Bryopsis sp. KO-2023]|nr:hypothetical protein BSKO_04623 [Bryopsis sp. KO-2023]
MLLTQCRPQVAFSSASPLNRNGRVKENLCVCSHSPGSSDRRESKVEVTRRSGLIVGGLIASQILNTGESSAVEELDTTFTHKVFLDIGICDTAFRSDRTLGGSAICEEPLPLGRMVIGLYGNVVPTTVSNFLTSIKAGSYIGTTFHKVIPGQYIMAGQQGSKRMGQVQPPPDLAPNSDVASAKAFKLDHSRPGTVSLSIGDNDDTPLYRERANYRNTEFLVTTGPGPAPQLDGEDIVFGRIQEGFDTLFSVAEIPTYTPSEKLKAFNTFASSFGDERAARARASWGRPLKAVVILDSGVL